ncbi:hypothetical protein B0F90DRAFT_1825190 [Multifurca ochricompacta]|uniref:Uncharacterized protein n=1 Tax=Multifurca ochricompacta TaxID=376703 RepID=A0AAD4QGV8_9AGAM|nr:hypothetical protein B0F90DRAFT_1825190 [Multifurca ochricompacta]
MSSYLWALTVGHLRTGMLGLAIHLNPFSSEPIGRNVDVSTSTIETSLAVLKEASSVMGKIPYISAVAGLLLQVLTMRDEVKQNKEEWGVVMRKLGRVASLVVNVGESCQKYDLEENDLPPGLRTILQSLQTELGGIEGALKQSVEVGHVRKVLLRRDLLRKVKQYDGELSNVLQTFQAELVLDVRFAQLVDRRKVIPTGLSGQSSNIMSMPQEPRSPQIFFGRDTELAIILHMVFDGIQSRPAQHFGNARYFVACESVFSSGALLVELAKTLGVLDEGSDASWAHICAKLNSKDTILCLDNFESPWDQASEVKYPVEELLSRITELHRVTVLVTMRGTVRPAQTHWTQPFLPSLTTLTLDAAREIWGQIAGNYDESAQELIKTVDYIPLAVNLLAHLAQAMPPVLLLKEWHKKQTGLIQTGQTHKLFNLEYSIQLSINSGKMRANPSAKDLLGILSMLPDGIHTEQLGRFEEILVDMDILSNLHVLQQCSLINAISERYQTHPIIRHFCNQQNFISSKHKNSLQGYYINLASSEPSTVQHKKHAEMVLEVNNTKAMLFDLLKSNYGDISNLVGAIITFTNFHAGIGDFSDKLISQTVETLQQRQSDSSLIIRCLQIWGRVYYFASDFENAKYKAQEAERLCSSSPYNNSSLHAGILTHLSELYQLLNALDEAESSHQKALKLHKIANDVLGQGNNHKGLGSIYTRLGRLQEAEASYKNALKLHKIANSTLGQGNDHRGLGDTYLRMNKLDEAEASYKNALEFHKAANDVLGQGNVHKGLGDTYLKLKRPGEAEVSYKNALELHKIAGSVQWQGNDHLGLGDTYLMLRQLDKAETSYYEALDLHKIANYVMGQGNDLHGLGKVYMERLNLEGARDMFEKALALHKKAHVPMWQKLDQKCLDEVLSKMGQKH